MSEQSPLYDVGNVLPETLEAFRNRACALPYSNPSYTPPSYLEVKRLLELAGWSQNDTAKLVGVSWNPKKGYSTVRKWKAPSEKSDSRDIPYSAWRLLLLYANVVTLEDDLCSMASQS